MPNAGDSFTVEVKQCHLGWGTERRTNTRTLRQGEAYIKIPKRVAEDLSLFNSNRGGENTLYDVECINGNQITGRLLAQGSTRARDAYAKQFSVQGDLTQIGQWYTSVGAEAGGHVRVTFTSETSLQIEYIPPRQQ